MKLWPKVRRNNQIQNQTDSPGVDKLVQYINGQFDGLANVDCLSYQGFKQKKQQTAKPDRTQ